MAELSTSIIGHRAGMEAAALRQWLVERGLLPGRRDYVRFVIVSGIRTGSTMLTRMLDTHSQVRCFFELFHIHPGAIPFNCEGYHHRAHDPAVLRKWIDDPARFLAEEVWTRMPPGVGAVGFKLLHTQARKGPMWWDEPGFADWWAHVNNADRHRWFGGRSDLWASLAGDRDVRIILLDRHNLLHQNVSAEMAKASGSWGDGASGGFGTGVPARITLPLETMLRDFAAARRMVAESHHLFRDNPLLRMTYEELASDPAGSATRVQQFLGIESRPVAVKTRRMMTRPYAEVVANWNEVQQLLRGTEWESFLEQ